MNADERKQLQRELKQLTKELDYLVNPILKEKVNVLRWQLYPKNFTENGDFSFPYRSNKDNPE